MQREDMNWLHATITVATLSAVLTVVTGHIGFLLLVSIASMAAGWVGMEQRYGDAEVN